MAKHFLIRTHFIVPLLAVCAMLQSGCQSQSTVVDALPPPNLNGPTVLPPPAPVRVAAVAPPIYVPHRAPARAPWGIPAAWIPDADAPPRPWKWIVIHHSATPTGSAAMFDKMHREKGWDELGYHFVIGNGTLTGDGQVEVGPRWPIQKHGAHAKTPDNRYNDYGIGICLVGNFEDTRPTSAQMRSLAKLVGFLMQRYRIPPDCVIRHGDTKQTLCPGRNLNILLVRRMATQMLADSGQSDGSAIESASAATPGELLMTK
jgi:hypothetical protein